MLAPFWITPNQRYLYPTKRQLGKSYDLRTGAILGTITRNSRGNILRASIGFSMARWPGIASSNGKVKIMDYLFGLNVVEAGRIDPHRVTASYDSAFQVLVSIGVDNKTSTLPGSLAFCPVESGLRSGHGLRLKREHRQGAADRPGGGALPGWWVDWYLEGGWWGFREMGTALRQQLLLWAISISTSVRRTRMGMPGISISDLMTGKLGILRLDVAWC